MTERGLARVLAPVRALQREMGLDSVLPTGMASLATNIRRRMP